MKLRNLKILVLLTFFLSTYAFAKVDITSKKSFVFDYGFKDVWASAQIVLGTYPLETNDIANGLIKTSLLKPGQFWQAPFDIPIEGNYTQTLAFQFYKRSPYQTELQILKTANQKTDFLGSETSVKTEPWEELRLVYKIKREIEIKKVLAQIK
jgi:hypothetical protein